MGAVRRLWVVNIMSKDAAPSEEEIERRQTAIGWWMRLDAGAPSPAEREEFAAWLTRDPANKAAFDDACCLWGDLECLRPLIATPAPSPRSPGLARFWPKGALALASLALAFFFSYDELSIRWRARELTGTAETRLVKLEDGSLVELGPNSAIDTDFSDSGRRLTLLKGEAWFGVSPDATRPFSVSVGGGTITALGTAFNIATENARIEVTVTQHRVRVSGAGPSVVVEEGSQSAFGPGVGAVAPYPVDVGHVTAWRRGKLIFDDKPLGEVVSILGRYHRGWFLIVDPAIRTRRVTGVFETADPLAALRAIERSLGLHAVTFGSLVLLGG